MYHTHLFYFFLICSPFSSLPSKNLGFFLFGESFRKKSKHYPHSKKTKKKKGSLSKYIKFPKPNITLPKPPLSPPGLITSQTPMHTALPSLPHTRSSAKNNTGTSIALESEEALDPSSMVYLGGVGNPSVRRMEEEVWEE